MKSCITFMMYFGLMCLTTFTFIGCDDTDECTVECPGCDVSELTDEEKGDLLDRARDEAEVVDSDLMADDADAGTTEPDAEAAEEDAAPAEEVEETDAAETPTEPEVDPEELDEDPTEDPSGAQETDPVIIFIPNGIPPTP